MIPVFIASNRGYAGKTFMSLGLGLMLMAEGYKVGYMKPIGRMPIKKGRKVFDADAVFMKEALSLTDPLNVISPLVLSYETQSLMLEGKILEAKKQVMEAFRAASKNKDFVIIEGAGDLFEGSALNIGALDLIPAMKARVLMIEPWSGDVSSDSLFGGMRLIGKNFAGAVINKVPAGLHEQVRDGVKPFAEKKGVKIFGVLKKDSLLESVTVRQLNEVLGGKVLCSAGRLDEFVENFSIGAMDVDSALNYFRKTPNKAVITGAHRSDIQLAAMETSTKCIILTGGLYTNDVVIGRAESKGIPLISVADDTFGAISRIEAFVGKSGISGKGKAARAKEIIGEGFDMKRFLKAVALLR
ncbi:MAG: phosphotransacetylase family protein [Thermodesulfovibrionales bacterium]|nr:phosphotransacetylase family protein [Thermodesulfovibrionales bacterium]